MSVIHRGIDDRGTICIIAMSVVDGGAALNRRAVLGERFTSAAAKANAPFLFSWGRRGHELPNGVENDAKFFIVFPLKIVELPRKFFVSPGQLTELDKGPDHENADFDRAW